MNTIKLQSAFCAALLCLFAGAVQAADQGDSPPGGAPPKFGWRGDPKVYEQDKATGVGIFFDLVEKVWSEKSDDVICGQLQQALMRRWDRESVEGRLLLAEHLGYGFAHECKGVSAPRKGALFAGVDLGIESCLYALIDLLRRREEKCAGFVETFAKEFFLYKDAGFRPGLESCETEDDYKKFLNKKVEEFCAGKHEGDEAASGDEDDNDDDDDDDD